MGDWLPPREPGEPAWAARGTVMLETRLRWPVIATVLGVLFAAVFLFSGLVVPAVAILAVAGVPGYWSFARARQADAARRTGWRTATVTLTGGTGTRLPSTVVVRFSDGSRIDLRPWEGGRTVLALGDLPGLPAVVAGSGPAAMTVLVLPELPWREKPVLFGARTKTYRWLPKR
ncbi:hypothetical protein AB0M80_17760 [Amycolatopsis sp. NPDC051045]|uniref:hypothetical protein n=1 Tax=Amycolatopsis sp. NPDC051045 TaxID=3156922 RepID=UPI00343360CD